MIKYLCIIQARMTSTRLPGKVMMLVAGKPMVKHVWEAAKGSMADKVLVAWPERYPDLDENDVRERFRRVSREFPSKFIIRLTADCPLLNSYIIDEAIKEFELRLKKDPGTQYYCNRDKHQDGYDVQIFSTHMLHNSYATHKEHVIAPEKHPTADKHLSVDTKEDLKKVQFFADMDRIHSSCEVI